MTPVGMPEVGDVDRKTLAPQTSRGDKGVAGSVGQSVYGGHGHARADPRDVARADGRVDDRRPRWGGPLGSGR